MQTRCSMWARVAAAAATTGFAVCADGVAAVSAGATAADASRPAVVELFTSEGCSSCPPADAFMGELAQRADVLALAFHVDYWYDLGWRDRFGIPEATPRQRGYAAALRLSSVYTPQIVIDGKDDFVGTNRGSIDRALTGSRDAVPIGLAVAGRTAVIEIGARSDHAECDVWLAAYRRSAETAIGRGENSGRTLTEYNIVRALRRLGRNTGAPQSLSTDLGTLPDDVTDVAVLLQVAGAGPILGAAHHAR